MRAYLASSSQQEETGDNFERLPRGLMLLPASYCSIGITFDERHAVDLTSNSYEERKLTPKGTFKKVQLPQVQKRVPNRCDDKAMLLIMGVS
jgi:hypothetical protein